MMYHKIIHIAPKAARIRGHVLEGSVLALDGRSLAPASIHRGASTASSSTLFSASAASICSSMHARHSGMGSLSPPPRVVVLLLLLPQLILNGQRVAAVPAGLALDEGLADPIASSATLQMAWDSRKEDLD